MKTYLIGKVGKALNFNYDGWKGQGGECDAIYLLEALAKTHPDDQFVIISRTNYTNNIPNVFSVCDYCSSDDVKGYEYICDVLKDIKVDGIIIFSGPCSSINVPDHAKTLKPNKYGTCEPHIFDQFKKYVGPLYHFLNTSMYPYCEILTDPRYDYSGRDLFNRPLQIVSQYETTFTSKHMKSYEDMETIENFNHYTTYNHVEKIFLLHNEMKDVSQLTKTNDFNIILNEGDPSRYNDLKEWVLDVFDDVNVYGHWSDKTKDDHRFKGGLKFVDAQKVMLSSKYSFIIPIAKGWVTSKYIELIANGVVPFYHPDYDTQNHTKINEFCRVKTRDELKEKIEKIKTDDKFYRALITDLQNQYREWTDPNKLCDEILRNVPQIENSGTKNFSEVYQKEETNLEDW